MSTCQRHPWDLPDGLCCTSETPHLPGDGCVFVGSSVDDLHTKSEQAAEVDRG